MTGIARNLAEWWAVRQPREQVLLGVLAALVIGLAAWYGVHLPLDRFATTQAERRAEASTLLVQTRELGALVRAVEAGAAGAAPTQTLQRTAAAAGIPLGETEPQPGGGLAVSIEAVPAKALLGWLAAVQRDHRIGVRRFEAHRGEDGAVQARIVFVGRGG